MPEGSTKKERRGNSGICAPLFIANGKVLFFERVNSCGDFPSGNENREYSHFLHEQSSGLRNLAVKPLS